MSFLSDTFSNNTQIYPIVTIEPTNFIQNYNDGIMDQLIYLSTNNVSLDHIHSKYYGLSILEDINFKPLLSKMPTINQSIDTKTRKFKVSDVTLNILNNEYHGERFSDTFDDKSLIGWKVSVQLVSPTAQFFSTMFETYSITGGVSFYDFYKNLPSHAPFMTQMVYQGKVRDAYQNKESVTLKLEDILGQKGHSTIPKVFTGYSAKMPEKYRGNPMPIVFGEVERSPLVVDEIDNELYIICDDVDESSKFYYTQDAQAFLTSNPLKILRDEVYVTVFSSHNDITYAHTIIEDESPNYTDTVQYTFNNDSPSIKIYKDAGGAIINPIKDDLAYCQIIQDADNWYVHQTADNYTAFASQNYIRYENQGNIFTGVEISKHATSGTDPDGQAYTILMRILRFDLGFPSAPGRVITHTRGEVNAQLQERIVIDFSGHYFHTAPIEVGTNGYMLLYFNTRSVSGEPDWSGHSNFIYPGETETVSLQSYNWGGRKDYDVGDKYICSVSSNIQPASDGVMWLEWHMDNDNYPISRTLNYFISDFFESDFYGHILGRTDGTTLIQNPITIMKYIAETFLGVSVHQASYDIALAEHSTWKFNFTIDEVINTKDLLEDMAQYTKCFIRFNEAGQLAFHTIKYNYLVGDWHDAITIDDAIAYTFKLTNLSEVVSRVDVAFGYDHGLQKYLHKTTTVPYSGYGVSDYYGIDENDNWKNIETKYISAGPGGGTTAGNLLGFLSKHNQNRRIIANLTLGLNHCNITVGSIIKFPKLLGGVKANGINYSTVDYINYQWVYPLFMVTSVKIGDNNIKIKAEQIPNRPYAIADATNWAALIVSEGLDITDKVATDWGI